jgi:hypothetical protein
MTPPVPHITEQSRPSHRIGCLSPRGKERAAWQKVERLTRRRSEPPRGTQRSGRYRRMSGHGADAVVRAPMTLLGHAVNRYSII